MSAGKTDDDIATNEVGNTDDHCEERRDHLLQVDKSNLQVKKVNYFKCEIGVHSVAVAGVNRMWVAHMSRDIMFLYNERGRVVKSKALDKGVGINDLVVKSSGEIIITNRERMVKCLSKEGKLTTLIATAPFTVAGICLTGTEELVLCMRGQGNRNHIAIYSPDGSSKMREMNGSDANNKHVITDPYRVAMNDTDFCVVNYQTNVVTIDQTGVLRWIYDATQNQNFAPHGICCDRYRNILVSDGSSHCVHYLDRDGQLIQMILTEKQIGLTCHWGIGVDDETGQVWVGNSTKDVIIAKYLK